MEIIQWFCNSSNWSAFLSQHGQAGPWRCVCAGIRAPDLRRWRGLMRSSQFVNGRLAGFFPDASESGKKRHVQWPSPLIALLGVLSEVRHRLDFRMGLRSGLVWSQSSACLLVWIGLNRLLVDWSGLVGIDLNRSEKLQTWIVTELSWSWRNVISSREEQISAWQRTKKRSESPLNIFRFSISRKKVIDTAYKIGAETNISFTFFTSEHCGHTAPTKTENSGKLCTRNKGIVV